MAQWIKRCDVEKEEKFESYTPVWICPQCGREFDPYFCQDFSFCPYCGIDVQESTPN